MATINDTRIDKYLWAIRIFKSRSIASEAIDGGKVKMEGASVKNSKKVKIGEVFVIRKEQQLIEIEVLKIIEKRLSATLVADCYKEIRNENLNAPRLDSNFILSNITRDKGMGRPTKRDRREIDDFHID